MKNLVLTTSCIALLASVPTAMDSAEAKKDDHRAEKHHAKPPKAKKAGKPHHPKPAHAARKPQQRKAVQAPKGRERLQAQAYERAKDARRNKGSVPADMRAAQQRFEQRASQVQSISARERDKAAKRAAKARADWRRAQERNYSKKAREIRERNDYRPMRVAYNYPTYQGCPPGLARKRNGCMPPGLAKKRAEQPAFFSNWFGPREYRDYRYDDGYLVRYSPNRAMSYVPLLGGALSVGNRFPDYYDSYAVPDYYTSWYGGNDDYIYRQSNGVIYALEPESYAIAEIAGLVTGDDFVIGQPAPSGYSVYNVPSGYRDQYYDTPTANYRYNNGYVYRIDPKTQLVMAAIQLLT